MFGNNKVSSSSGYPKDELEYMNPEDGVSVVEEEKEEKEESIVEDEE
jgi:hypothetical protein